MCKSATTYIFQSHTLIAVLTVLVCLGGMAWGDLSLMAVPMVVAAGFQVVACLSYGMAWSAVARRSTASLPVFYLAASGIRMLLGVATVVIYLFLVSDASAVRVFIFLFLAYYLVLLVYDTFYFVRKEKKIHQNI